jgi:uncharacterized membrane protein YqiK
MDWVFYGVVVGVLIVAILVIFLIVSNLYKRAPKGKAFVRTGWGGQKVVKDGGALIVPILHETMEVNMSTLKLEVHRNGKDALRTKDKMKVDVTATFYTKVKPDDAAIGMAAQTLGDRTMNPDALRVLVEDKFVDALRSVAASMNLSDLNEKRTEFSEAVKNAIEHDLVKNGLELENVSVTRLDQTDIQYMNENDVFDAEGLANITRVTQAKSKERNDVQQDTRIQIQQRNFEANQKSLAIKQQDEFATLDQVREVETRRALQESELAKQRADRTREADIAKLEAERATAIARTAAQQAQNEATIKTEQELAIARQVSQIAIAEKSEAQSQAQAKADEARALSVKAAQDVITAEAVAKAEREGQVAVIAAQKKAEENAAGITVRAKAEAEAADLQAQARLKLADVTERENVVKAAGERALAEAANSLNADQINLRLRTALISALPEITKNMAAPMTAVKGARIVSINGMGPGGATVAGNGSGSSNNLPGQLTDAMLGYRLQLPLVEQMAKEVGIDFTKGFNSMFDGAYDAPIAASVEEVAAEEVYGKPSTHSTQDVAEMARLKKIVEKNEK